MPISPALARRICLTLAACIVIAHFSFGAMPGAVNFVKAPWDLLLHALLYGTVAFLVNTGLGGRRPLVALAVAGLIGAADEALQSFEPGRHADALDLMANLAGAFTGAFVSRHLSFHAWR